MTSMTATAARQNFSEVMNLVRYRGERLVLHRKGKRFAAFVPLEDLELLEALEDHADAQALRRAILAAQHKSEKPIPLRQARKLLGL